MGFFNKPLLPARYDNEDVQISAELCSNIAIRVVGLAKGEITILSGSEDMIHIKTSVQAKESILKNAAALEPVQDGDRYTYTIHTPLEHKLEKAVTFQVFVTVPRNLEALESFTVEGTNIELSIGNIGHTFIKNLTVNNHRGDIAIDNFYGESATIHSTVHGGVTGKYSVARLYVNAKSGRIHSRVHLLNTDDQLPPPKVLCTTAHHPVNVDVDGTDLFGPFSVEAKTQTQPLDVKILLASTDQRLLGNFINFGGPTKIRLSGNYQGRIETRTHYGNIYIHEPEFEPIEGAVLSLPSLSDRNHVVNTSHKALSSSSSSSSLNASTSHTLPSRSSSTGTNMSLDRDHHDSLGLSIPPSTHGSAQPSRAPSISGSLSDTRSLGTSSEKSKKKKEEEKEKEKSITKELIGTIGYGSGLIMAKNSSGDITLSLI